MSLVEESASQILRLANLDWARFSSKEVCLIPNDGNSGDGLIALGIRHYLLAAGINVQICSKQDSRLKRAKVVIYGDGGNLIPLYNTGINFLEHMYDAGKEIIVLPHTTYGLEDRFIRMANRITIFARELESYSRLEISSFPHARLGLDHDMAFHIEPLFWLNLASANSVRTAYCYRTDRERSSGTPSVPEENVDISRSWDGDFWFDENLTNYACLTLVAYLRRFKRVETDRLHVAILAGLMGLPTKFYGNSYYKNEAVFNFSIASRLRSVQFQKYRGEYDA